MGFVAADGMEQGTWVAEIKEGMAQPLSHVLLALYHAAFF